MTKAVQVGPSIIFDRNPDRPDPTEEQKEQAIALVNQLREYPGSVIHNVEVKDGKIYGESKMSILVNSIIRGHTPTEEADTKRSKASKLLNVAFVASSLTLAVIEGYNLYTLVKELKSNGN